MEVKQGCVGCPEWRLAAGTAAVEGPTPGLFLLHLSRLRPRLPHPPPALPLDEFKLQVLQSLVIKVELALEQAVRYAPAPLHHRQRPDRPPLQTSRRLLPISSRTLVALRAPIIPQDIGRCLDVARRASDAFCPLSPAAEIDNTLALMRYHLRNHRIIVVWQLAPEVLPLLHVQPAATG